MAASLFLLALGKKRKAEFPLPNRIIDKWTYAELNFGIKSCSSGTKVNLTACNRTGRLRINSDPTKFSGHMPYRVVICNAFRHNNDQTSYQYANPGLVNVGREPSLR